MLTWRRFVGYAHSTASSGFLDILVAFWICVLWKPVALLLILVEVRR
jgi:hypothetical protein